MHEQILRNLLQQELITPEDAFRCFMGTEIEALAVGNCFLKKEEQNPELRLNYETAFELD